jgi:2,4-dichlorophenol 6-monooxygenase
MPLMSLVKPGHFLLIAGEDGRAWCDAARGVAKDFGLPLDAVTIGHIDGDYRDPRLAWVRQREISAQGAVLVRPDRVVAWRNMGAAKNSTADLAAALSQILGRA